jgi:hypothetical protein
VIPAQLLLLFLLLLQPREQSVKFPSGNPSEVPDPLLQVGEDLEYNVTYSIFNIGTIKIQVYDKGVRGSRDVFKARAIIDSNPSLAWLKEVHIRFYCEMDGDVFSYSWLGDDSTAQGLTYRRITFQYDNNVVFFEKGKVEGMERIPSSIDTVRVSEKYQDGLSLFFFARKHVRQKKQMHIPTLIENKQVTTIINFLNRRSDVEIGAVDYPVEVVEFNGKAEYVGVFGLTGGFSGWFSNDEARVPILARMNVILGSIKVELRSWRREGWQPPKYPATR